MRRFAFKFVLLSAATILIPSMTALPACAQFPMAAGPTAERSQSDSDRDLEERIANMRYLAALAEKRGSGRKKDPKLALEELQEDFTRLQIVNKELVLTTSRSTEVDFKFVAKSASEINKRATRLLSNLALPEPDADASRRKPEPMSDSKQLKTSITTLGWLIYRFTKNPIFKEAKVIETPAATKARRDLEDIIELSFQIKKSSEQLGKRRRPRQLGLSIIHKSIA